MIDPKLLTKENGFVEWVVVEIVWIAGGVSYWEYPLWLSEEPHISRLLSIRPLTGPMAIWNFAPEWASLIIQNSNGWFWMNHRPDELAQSDVVTYRPFWAKANP